VFKQAQNNSLIAIVTLLFSQVLLAGDPTKPKAGFSAKNKTVQTSSDTTVKKSQALKLQSIIKKNNKKIAIISGKHIRVGQKIRGYRLSYIAETYVILKTEQTSLKLFLFNHKNRLEIKQNGTKKL
jgi:hypothetical protein